MSSDQVTFVSLNKLVSNHHQYRKFIELFTNLLRNAFFLVISIRSISDITWAFAVVSNKGSSAMALSEQLNNATTQLYIRKNDLEQKLPKLRAH